MEDNINEIAKGMTREEFLKKLSHGICPSDYGLSELSVFGNCIGEKEKCGKCRKESIKDIKFKDDIEEIFEAECIDPGYNEKNGQLTINKVYPVKQSKYTNFYELTNDLGNIETYRKERFKKVEKPIMKVGLIEFYENGNLAAPISKEAYEKAEKVANDLHVSLNKAKENFKFQNIDDIKEIINKYQLEGEKAKKVRCINNLGTKKCEELTLNKEYPVINEDEKYYIILNDKGNKYSYYKESFEEVEEKKEYSVMELLNFEVGTEFKNTESNCYVKVVNIEGIKAIVTINKENDCNKWDKETVAPINEAWRELKFTKVEEPKPVSFIEAWKVQEEGTEVVSSKGYHYKNNQRQSMSNLNCWYNELSLGDAEIKGQWLIIG